jgi:hypothetical protein
MAAGFQKESSQEDRGTGAALDSLLVQTDLRIFHHVDQTPLHAVAACMVDHTGAGSSGLCPRRYRQDHYKSACSGSLEGR